MHFLNFFDSYIESQKSYFDALMNFKQLENQKKLLLEYENSTHLITQSAVQLKFVFKYQYY